MTGCFGNDIEDKYYEDQLLNETDPDGYCLDCGELLIECECSDDEVEELDFMDII